MIILLMGSTFLCVNNPPHQSNKLKQFSKAYLKFNEEYFKINYMVAISFVKGIAYYVR